MGLWERIILRPMRISFALCAWALLLAAPRVHGLRPRDPAKLLAGPQSMRWRSDRDRATRATPTTICLSLTGQSVQGPEVSPRTTWARSLDLLEPILVMSISPSNSDAAYRVGRLEGGPADTQISPKFPSATSTWNIFQLSRQSTHLTENTQDILGSLSTMKYIIDSSILDILAEA